MWHCDTNSIIFFAQALHLVSNALCDPPLSWFAFWIRLVVHSLDITGGIPCTGWIGSVWGVSPFIRRGRLWAGRIGAGDLAAHRVSAGLGVSIRTPGGADIFVAYPSVSPSFRLLIGLVVSFLILGVAGSGIIYRFGGDTVTNRSGFRPNLHGSASCSCWWCWGAPLCDWQFYHLG